MASSPLSKIKIVDLVFDIPPQTSKGENAKRTPQWVPPPSKFSRPNVNRLFDRDLEVVKFYDAHTDSPFYRFSSFACFPIFIDGLKFSSVEHYLEYKKFLPTDPVFAEKLRNSRTPYECKKMTRSARDRGDPEWISKGLQLAAMRTALFNKAMQWPEFLNDLLSTGRAYIIQNSPYDSFWGVGNEGKGANTLGKLLIELRAELIPSHHLRFQDFVPQLEPTPAPRPGPRGGRHGDSGGYFPRPPRGPIQGAEIIDIDDYAETSNSLRDPDRISNPEEIRRHGVTISKRGPSSPQKSEAKDDESDWSESSE